jgi:hypothetical protein
MNPQDKPASGKEAAKPKLSRSEEALRIIEDCARALRETIKKLRLPRR